MKADLHRHEAVAMRLARVPCHDLDEVDRYHDEATRLLREAEIRLLQIHRDEAFESVRQTTADLVAAMQRIHRMIEAQRDAAVRGAAVIPRVIPASGRRRRWPLLAWIRAR
ncbi:hypothetical protein [Methylobacterium planeticum]|uniref:Uncharacterized protein n=1 Tax=Methylobacterium planeticum TaxID=2615211 RepID=A0A6N6MRU8_9HYPH|nr:hypothetical protein [Methylobacterium planeticum]KAB1074445.1 hypothetical protein F6X51_08775 [Methylobacterium planeticum]